jgi:hypothetical protein
MDKRTASGGRGRVRQPSESSGCESQACSTLDAWAASRKAERIQRICASLGLTITRISELTRTRYGRNTPYFIPPTFRFRVSQGISPRLHQIVALSQVTNYRFSDWMKFFGFDLQLIFALQLRVHNERTAMITPGDVMAAGTSPLSTGDENNDAQNAEHRYLFAKIGSRDAVLYPRLVPGTIVRVDRSYRPEYHARASLDERIWLVEHSAGLTCCHVKPIDHQQVLLLPNFPPLSPWPLRLHQQARVLGRVDLELRPWSSAGSQPVNSAPVRESSLQALPETLGTPGVSSLLRACRARAGLTLRAAHEMTVRIASLLGDRDYEIALGLLSDYEAVNKLPRHVAKMISLSVVYGVDPLELVKTAGIHIDDRDKAPLVWPERMAVSGKRRAAPSRSQRNPASLSAFNERRQMVVPHN